MEDLVTSNFPQVYDSPVDISHCSRIVTLTIPYDDYVVYTFTYADIPSVRSTIIILILYV